MHLQLMYKVVSNQFNKVAFDAKILNKMTSDCHLMLEY